MFAGMKATQTLPCSLNEIFVGYEFSVVLVVRKVKRNAIWRNHTEHIHGPSVQHAIDVAKFNVAKKKRGLEFISVVSAQAVCRNFAFYKQSNDDYPYLTKEEMALIPWPTPYIADLEAATA